MSIISASAIESSLGYQISRSVRLRSSASAYFNRTPASAGNRKTWTWSGWVKRGSLGGTQTLLAAGLISGTYNYTRLFFDTSDRLVFAHYPDALSGWLTTAQVFRDPSAWYHIDAIFNSTAATASDRMRLFVNGVQITAFTSGAFATTYPALNTDSFLNTTSFAANIGRNVSGGTAETLDGYLTEVNFIDGQALTPSSFGQNNPITGVWEPKQYTGTYGTNGFYLNFSDPSAATAAAIGKDSSGNGNNWTPNNISVTAGVTYDSMLDVPTLWADGGNGRGNYAVVNPLSTIAFPVTNGNLSIGASTTANRCSKSSIAVSSGKWYWEFKASAMSASGQIAGICSADALFSGGAVSSGFEVGYYSINGNKYVNGTASAYGASWTTSDTIGVALDVDGGTVTFYKNNTSQGSISITAGQSWVASWTGQNVGDAVDYTFGQRPFAYTPPTGFKALNTQNLPEPTIKKGNLFFDATTYTGNGSTLTVTNSGSMQPDLVWIKVRSTSGSHVLQDSVRGPTAYLQSNATAAENTNTANDWFRSFNSNGFTVAGSTTGGIATTEWDSNGNTFVGWQWKANGAGVSNTAGSITSTVSAGVTQGFSVVTWSGTSTNASTIGHGLGVAPKMIITKSRTNLSSWVVGIGGISGMGVNDYLVLQTTGAKGSSSTFYQAYGSSTFTVGVSAADEMNKTGNNYVSYCFAEVPGFSRFGSYTGNGSADGPFVFCGFRPRFVLYKRTDVSGTSWGMIDTARNTFNLANNSLYANVADAEYTTLGSLDFVSNGFKIRSSDTNINSSGNTFIFAAFAENPFKNALAR